MGSNYSTQAIISDHFLEMVNKTLWILMVEGVDSDKKVFSFYSHLWVVRTPAEI